MIPDHHSRGGRARAAKLSPERRREIAILAANKRWSTEVDPMIRAAAIAFLKKGEIGLDVAVALTGARRPTVRGWIAAEGINLADARALRVAALRKIIATRVRAPKSARTLGETERRYVRRRK